MPLLHPCCPAGLCRLMTALFGTPVSTVTLIGEANLWLKSSAGPFGSCVDRMGGFCNFILVPSNPEVVVIEVRWRCGARLAGDAQGGLSRGLAAGPCVTPERALGLVYGREVVVRAPSLGVRRTRARTCAFRKMSLSRGRPGCASTLARRCWAPTACATARCASATSGPAASPPRSTTPSATLRSWWCGSWRGTRCKRWSCRRSRRAPACCALRRRCGSR